MADYLKGTPVFFFVAAPTKRGVPNALHIEQLEDFLIQAGFAANPHLLNIKGTKAERWGIVGIIRGGKGKTSSDAKKFRKIMKI